MKDRLILAVNPGGTSTKLGLFRDDEQVFEESIHHDPSELEPFGSTFDQMNFRRDIVLAELNKRGIHRKTSPLWLEGVEPSSPLQAEHTL